MKRLSHFDYIEEKLGTLGYRINLKGKLNILDLHNHSETFYFRLINIVYGLELQNANQIKQNVEAIDLIDTKNKVFCQVSSTNTKQKVDDALSKESLKKYPGYTFKFISIANGCAELRKKTFTAPNGISFNPLSDIIDNKSILDRILNLSVPEQKTVYEFIKLELGTEPDIIKLDTNLAVIINILSKEDLTTNSSMDVDGFEIDRKIDFNSLVVSRPIIEDYAKYYTRVDKKYVEFDMQGVNKSVSVLASINRCYLDALVKNHSDTSDEIFIKVIDGVSNKVAESANFIEIPIDELELSVSILVVDAFIRCKIFKNPKNYQYVTP